MADVIMIQTISELLGVTPVADQLYQVAGYYSANDGGGGLWRWDDTSTEQANYGTVIGKWNDAGDPPSYITGRYLLVHDGVVNVRQFGALGNSSNDDLNSQIDGMTYPVDRFFDTDHVKATYPSTVGTAFSGLLMSDTVDWAAIQVALEWCGAKGVRCEIPSGVYKASRPVWMGDDSTYLTNESGDKDVRVMGLTFVGQTGNSRQQADGGVANIRLINDCTNRFALSVVHAPPMSGKFILRCKTPGSDIDTVEFDGTETATFVMGKLDEVLNPNPMSPVYVISLMGTSGATVLNTETVYFTVRPDVISVPPEFLFEILAVDVSPTPDAPTNWAHCFPDSGIVSFRRSAGVNYRLEHLTLKGNAENEDNDRFASFGVAFVTTQFFGHIVENLEMAYIDTAIGILKGTGNNGEQTRVDRLHALEVRRMLYTNAPQAFSQEFLGWNCQLQNIDHVEGLENIVFAEFDRADSPGFGANFYNASCTFSEHDYPRTDATVVRAKRGTGTVQFIGGRFEHTTCLFNYDAYSSQGINNNMDVIFRGVEFSVVGGDTRRLVYGEDFEDVGPADNTYTQYGLFVDACTFDTFNDGDHPEYGDLILETKPLDRVRCVFEKSRFMGIRALQSQAFPSEFVRCYKTDFRGAGVNDTPLRQFTTTTGIPGDRTQSIRTVVQDTPHVQTGPRVNILRASDFVLQNDESTSDTDLVDFTTVIGYPWTLVGGQTADKIVFGKWGSFSDANIDMSPAAFYLGLQPGDALTPADPQIVYNDLKAFHLDGTVSKVATYQCLCRVKGKVRFAIVNSDSPSTVYDETVIDSQDDFTDLIQVTLRAQLAADGGSTTTYFRVVIENLLVSTGTLTGMARLKVLSQQAWGGKAGDGTYPLPVGLTNSTFAYTSDGAAYKSTYPWSANALSVRAQSRLKIPSKPSRYGWEQRSLIEGEEADLFNGDVYYDEEMIAVLMVMNSNQMFSVYQAERISSTSSLIDWSVLDTKNILSNGTSGQAIIRLDTDANNVPDGTVVRIYDKTTTLGTTAVKWGHGSGVADVTIDRNKASEFVFIGGKWRSTWHNITYAAQP